MSMITYILTYLSVLALVAWRSGSVVRRMNEVTLR